MSFFPNVSIDILHESSWAPFENRLFSSHEKLSKLRVQQSVNQGIDHVVDKVEPEEKQIRRHIGTLQLLQNVIFYNKNMQGGVQNSCHHENYGQYEHYESLAS